MGKSPDGGTGSLGYVTNQGWSANTWYRIKLVAQGSSLKAYVNDILKIDASDTSYTSGIIGFNMGFYMPSGIVSWYLDNINLSTIESKIAFYSNRDGNYEIYVMNPDGTNQTRLTNNNAEDAQPSWSPDGTKIVFESDRDGNNEIYVMNADGTNQVRLTNNSATDSQPAWLPDGTKIAFRTNRDGNDEIYVMNPNGTNPVNLTNNFTPWGSGYCYNDFDGEPRWSPDGTKIAFSSWRGGTADIWVMNADGTNPQQLTFGRWAHNPAWSPDGTKIAYSASGNIFVMNADGTNQTSILNSGCCISAYVGSWSPDGTKIVIYSDRFDGNFEIYTINSDGTNRTRLTNNSAEDSGASWSPILPIPYSATHSISGRVTENGVGLGGVTLTLDSSQGDLPVMTISEADGTYSFTVLVNGSYTVTPSKAGYNFDPPSRTVTISGADAAGQDFSACIDTLSGTLKDAITNKPLSGIAIAVDGTPSATTDANGFYSISGLSCGVHIIGATVSGYYDYIYSLDISDNPILDINLTKPQTVNGLQNFSGKGPDPVNTATGNYIYQKRDSEIPGRGPSFIFERTYNSQDAQDGPLGFGWTHSYNVKLTANPDSTVTIRWGDGKTETWTPDGSGGYTPQYGVFDTLIDNGDGTYTLKKEDASQYNFDGSGGLTSIVDKNDNTISLTYTGGKLTQITDTVGRVIAFTYNPSNHITQITDPIGRMIQFAYDANGDLLSATDRNGNTTTYTYDANHQMLTATDPLGNTFATNIYDNQKRVVVSQKDAKQGVTVYLYDEVNRKTTIIDQLGNPTIHYHDELLRLTQEEDARGNSTFYTYDSAGNRTEVKDKNGNTTKYSYDSMGNVTSKTDAMGNVTTITYDAGNNPLTRTDALGNTTTFEYDATSGNLTKTTDPLGNYTTITYDAYGQPLTITDANGNTTTNVYNAEGNLMEVTDPLGNKTTYTYDGVGRRLTVTDAYGRTTTYSYDNNNNLLTVTDALGNISSYTYDANNNKLTSTDPLGNTTDYSYDVKDLLTTITNPLSNTLSYTYDALDRKTSVTDKNGNATGFAYDAVGNLIEVADPLGNKTTYTHDANGNKLMETDPLGNTTSYTYDTLNRVVTATDPLGNTTTNTYDKLGRVVSTTNAKGQTTSFEYDDMGRLKKVTDANGGTVTYTYDANGNRLTMTDPNGNITSYEYDALNRLKTKTEPLGGQYQYAYDAVGNMVSLTNPKGDTITYIYNALNRLVDITYPDATAVSFVYDANSNRTQMTDSLGTSAYAYDVLNRLTGYTDPFGKTVGYGYDANGNRTSLVYPDGKLVQYGYDPLNRLTSITDWLLRTTTYTYDAAGRLTGTVNPNTTTAAYTYDAVGRLTGLINAKGDSSTISSYIYTLDAIGNHTQVLQDEPLIPLIPEQNLAYTYDAENRMTGAGGVINNFDPNGNMTAKGSDTFTYDYNDRLIQSNIGGVVTQYSYDGLGNRLMKVSGGITTRYVLDINGRLSNVLAETDASGTIAAYYVHGLGLISKILPDGTAYYYHYDSRGSTIALTDGSENVPDAYAYDPFGRLANSSGTTANPFRYVGRYGVMEEGNGLSYIRARYYIPELGRFITKDSLTGKDGDNQSLNRYVYALNNPVGRIDISGLSPQEIERIENINTASSDVEHRNLLASVDVSSQVIWMVIKEGASAVSKGLSIMLKTFLGGIKLKKAGDFASIENHITYIDNLYDTDSNAKKKIDMGITSGKKWNELTRKQKEMELPTVTAVLGEGWTGKYIFKRAVEEGLYPVCIGCP